MDFLKSDSSKNQNENVLDEMRDFEEKEGHKKQGLFEQDKNSENGIDEGLQKKQEQSELYEREDSETGFAQNLTEISFLKANRKYEVIANRLLGNFDEKGHYLIDENILNELVLLKKVVGAKTESGTTLKARYKNESFEFLLKYNGLNEKKTEESATLFLVERIEKVNGYIINKLITPVATFSSAITDNFQEFCYQSFHIVKNQDDESQGAMGGDAFNIDKRLAYLLAVKEASKGAYVELEEIYFNTRLSILDSIPQGALILSEFAKKRALLERYFIGNDRNKFRALNELLTAIIEANPTILRQMPVFDVMIRPLNNRYLLATVEISKKIKISEKYKALENVPAPVSAPVGMGGAVKVEKGGKKPAPAQKAKPKAKEKSSGGPKKKSGGGGGGKKDKKKDTKKKDKGKDKKAKAVGKVPPLPQHVVQKKPEPKKAEAVPEKPLVEPKKKAEVPKEAPKKTLSDVLRNLDDEDLDDFEIDPIQKRESTSIDEDQNEEISTLGRQKDEQEQVDEAELGNSPKIKKPIKLSDQADIDEIEIKFGSGDDGFVPA